MLAHSLEELGNTRSYQDVDLTDLTLDLDWKNDICIFNWFELRVHKSFIQIEDKRLSSGFWLSLRANEPIFFFFTGLFLLLLLWLCLFLLRHLLSLGCYLLIRTLSNLSQKLGESVIWGGGHTLLVTLLLALLDFSLSRLRALLRRWLMRFWNLLEFNLLCFFGFGCNFFLLMFSLLVILIIFILLAILNDDVALILGWSQVIASVILTLLLLQLELKLILVLLVWGRSRDNLPFLLNSSSAGVVTFRCPLQLLLMTLMWLSHSAVVLLRVLILALSDNSLLVLLLALGYPNLRCHLISVRDVLAIWVSWLIGVLIRPSQFIVCLGVLGGFWLLQTYFTIIVGILVFCRLRQLLTILKISSAIEIGNNLNIWLLISSALRLEICRVFLLMVWINVLSIVKHLFPQSFICKLLLHLVAHLFVVGFVSASITVFFFEIHIIFQLWHSKALEL